ncbi:Uncharacterised protein [Anaerobiospirillum thomasii]|uniref:Uncharacterized protein n=1 Tax=Anaerobiospirillum thomasii TaxID=179995 RepID=A0A2X0WD21_9GAMM|nr:hypothetical protein [Anaerobiospirillum thomasii]SPT68187.1 Uncharacterised protein [Anaerobiospirillum thomasii]SPT70663.1 Uncharacterised protein [Anaerobiospirillum thomasii]
MNGVVLITGALLLIALIKLIIDRNYAALVLFALAMVAVFASVHQSR